MTAVASLTPAERLVWLAVAGLAVLFVITLVPLALDRRLLDFESVWAKPLKLASDNQWNGNIRHKSSLAACWINRSSSSKSEGSRNARNSPRATASGNEKWYRPRTLM